MQRPNIVLPKRLEFKGEIGQCGSVAITFIRTIPKAYGLKAATLFRQIHLFFFVAIGAKLLA